MRILMLNGNPHSSSPEFEKYLSELSQALQSRHTLIPVLLRDLELAPCTSCWNCWIKTPGECIIADASPDICRLYLQADLVLLASPILMGFTSALLKHATERLLPLIHPHLEIANHALRHKGRYSSYPKIGLLLGLTKTGDKDDVKIIAEIYRHMAAHFSTSLQFVKLTCDPVKEVAHVINSL